MYSGPEYVSAALQNWASRRAIRIEIIQPGNPQQNAYVERFNRTVRRYEWLAQYLFDRIEEVQYFATQWLLNYNYERPNMALGGFTPKQRLAMAAKFLPAAMVKTGGFRIKILGRHRNAFLADEMR